MAVRLCIAYWTAHRPHRGLQLEEPAPHGLWRQGGLLQPEQPDHGVTCCSAICVVASVGKQRGQRCEVVGVCRAGWKRSNKDDRSLAKLGALCAHFQRLQDTQTNKPPFVNFKALSSFPVASTIYLQ